MRPGAKSDVIGTRGGAAGLGVRLRRSPARCAARDYHHMGVVDVERLATQRKRAKIFQPISDVFVTLPSVREPLMLLY
jgi:hypothetical protein